MYYRKLRFTALYRPAKGPKLRSFFPLSKTSRALMSVKLQKNFNTTWNIMVVNNSANRFYTYSDMQADIFFFNNSKPKFLKFMKDWPSSKSSAR